MDASTRNPDVDNDPYVWATIGENDSALFASELKNFVPSDAFDAHAHLWRVKDLGTPTPPLAAAGPANVTRAIYDERMSLSMPDRCRCPIAVRPVGCSFPSPHVRST